MFVHVFASVTGWNHFFDAPWGYTEYRILGAMDSCPSGPGGGGGVENVTIWHTKRWNHRFYRGRSSQKLALDVSFRAGKKTPAPAIKITSKSSWEGRTVWNNEWTNHFNFVFLLLCEILPMPLPFGCFSWHTRLPEQAAFLLPSATSALRSAQFMGSQSGRQMLPGWILTRYLSTWIIPKIAFSRLKVGTNIKMHKHVRLQKERIYILGFPPQITAEVCGGQKDLNLYKSHSRV